MIIYLLNSKNIHWFINVNDWNVQTFVISILIALNKIWLNPVRWYLKCTETLIGFHIINSWVRTDWMSSGSFSEESHTSRNGTKWLDLSISDLFFVCLCLSQPSVSQRARQILSNYTRPWCSLKRDSGSLSFVLSDLSIDDLDLW